MASWYDSKYVKPFWNISSGLSDIGLGGNTADTSPDTNAIKNAAGLQRSFVRQQAGQTAAYDPTQAGVNTANQNLNIAQLQAQANGTAPSAAQMQLQQQGQRNAAGAYGMAAALQGRNPGAALRSAQQTSLQTQGQTNAQAAQQRASDMATAQSGLASALSGMQGQQANLRSQDITQQQNLAGDVLGASGQQVTAAGNTVTANAGNAQTKNSVLGGLIGGGASILSDPTEKTDIHAAPLDKLADALKGFTFDYKHPGTPGEAPGRRVGIMATDALKGGPVGRSMVQEDAGSGKLALDGGNSLGAALAMAAEALRRTRKAA